MELFCIKFGSLSLPLLFISHPCCVGGDSMGTLGILFFSFLPLKLYQSMLIYLLTWKYTGRIEEEWSYSWGFRAPGSNGDIHCFHSSDIRSVFKILGQEQADGFWHHATTSRPSSTEHENTRHTSGCSLCSSKYMCLTTAGKCCVQANTSASLLSATALSYNRSFRFLK